MLHLATALVGGTGLVYAWMRYLLPPLDPYAAISIGHPLQPAVQHGHVLAAPLLVFATGMIWQKHVWAHWRSGVPHRRRTGLALMLSLVPMMVSGYLLQVSVTSGWRRAWLLVHLGASALFLLGYGGHTVVAVLGWWKRRDLARHNLARRGAMARAALALAEPSISTARSSG
jgi:hypothetical protein